jgi:hypothetical protein
MMMMPTHGLFAHKNPVFIFTQRIINYLGITPCVKGEKRTPLTWKAGLLLIVANSIHSGPLPGINCPPLTFQSPLTPSHPFAHTMLQCQHQQLWSSWSGTGSMNKDTQVISAVYYFTHLVAFYEDNILSFFLRYREIF